MNKLEKSVAERHQSSTYFARDLCSVSKNSRFSFLVFISSVCDAEGLEVDACVVEKVGRWLAY